MTSDEFGSLLKAFCVALIITLIGEIGATYTDIYLFIPLLAVGICLSLILFVFIVVGLCFIVKED